MPYGIDENGREYAKYPCSGRIVYEDENIIAEFGYRKMGNGSIIPQSYYRICRIAKCTADCQRHPRI